jgi:phospholipid/cholesterol/gamma-HCH transport system substrate-binding protein
MTSRLGQPRSVGVIGLAVAILLGLAVVVVSNLSLGAREYHAELAQTAGLRVGESVQIAGVEVGEIRNLRLEEKHVLVTFTVDSSHHLGSDSRAEVEVATLLGTHYLQIHPAGSGVLAEGTIPLNRTAVPFNLQDVIDKGTDQLEALDTDAMARALSSITEVMRASGQNFGPALKGVTRLSRMVTRRGDEYAALFGATRSVADQLSASARDLLTLMRTSNLVIAELTGRRDKIHRLLLDVQQLATTVSGIVDDNEHDLKPLLADLGVVVTVLRQRESEIRKAVHTVSVSSRYLANASGNGPWIDLYSPDGTPDSVYCKTRAC